MLDTSSLEPTTDAVGVWRDHVLCRKEGGETMRGKGVVLRSGNYTHHMPGSVVRNIPGRKCSPVNRRSRGSEGGQPVVGFESAPFMAADAGPCESGSAAE